MDLVQTVELLQQKLRSELTSSKCFKGLALISFIVCFAPISAQVINISIIILIAAIGMIIKCKFSINRLLDIIEPLMVKIENSDKYYLEEN